LTYDTANITQPVTLGVDAGSKTVGFSATSATQELFTSALKPRNDLVKLLSDRRAHRRNRRNRKTRYRKPRFNNRVHSKHKGWLAPSVETKIHNHIQGINLITKILPITKIVVETAEFDTQRLKAMQEGNPLPVGSDYQMGEQYDHYNVRQYILHRDGYRCRICGCKHGDKHNGVETKFHIHHLESRATGGDAPNNLITLCSSCHSKYHEGKQPLPDTIRKPRPMRDAAFMGVMRKSLVEQLRVGYPDIEIRETYGYITKCMRETAKMSKTHINDAVVISGNLSAKRISDAYLLKLVRAHNRKIHKDTIYGGGKRKLNQTPKYVYGYQLFDKVRLPDGREGFVWGRRTRGIFKVSTLRGEVLYSDIDYKKLTRLECRKSLLVERGCGSSPSINAGVPAA
jgi:N6-L-threonylcarbamoyladenine synthase